VLTSGRARAEAQPTATPFTEASEHFARGFHLLQNFLRVLQKLFTRLRQQDFFAQPVQKTAAHVALERLH